MGSRAVFLITPFLFSISVSYDAFMRYQAARSAAIAKWACILSGLLVIVISFCAALIGAVGKQAFPEVRERRCSPTSSPIRCPRFWPASWCRRFSPRRCPRPTPC